MSGDVLKDLWGLCFTKEAGGEVVECVLPGDDNIGGHSRVKWDLVEPCCHVCFGDVDVWGEKQGKGG